MFNDLWCNDIVLGVVSVGFNPAGPLRGRGYSPTGLSAEGHAHNVKPREVDGQNILVSKVNLYMYLWFIWALTDFAVFVEVLDTYRAYFRRLSSRIMLLLIEIIW